jgi:hypothetical protein
MESILILLVLRVFVNYLFTGNFPAMRIHVHAVQTFIPR